MGGWGVAFFSWHLAVMTGGELCLLPLLFIVPLTDESKFGGIICGINLLIVGTFCILPLMVVTGMYTCVTFHRTVHPSPSPQRINLTV